MDTRGKQTRITYHGEGVIQGVRATKLSADGKSLAAIVTIPAKPAAQVWEKRSEVVVWDAETGVERNRLRGHDGTIESLAFNPAATRLFTSGTEVVKCWDAGTGQELLTLPVEGLGNLRSNEELTTFPDGRTLALLASGRALFWKTSGYED